MVARARWWGLVVVVFSLEACSVGMSGVLYQENFDGPANPGWTTNDPVNMYWDQPTGRYHVLSWDGSNTYAYFPVPIPAGVPYTLAFDFMATRLDAGTADLRFGLGDPDMNIDQPSQWFASLANVGGNGAWVHIDSGAPGGTIYHGFQAAASLTRGIAMRWITIQPST